MKLAKYKKDIVGLVDCTKEEYFGDPAFSRSQIVRFLENPAASVRPFDADPLAIRIGTVHDAFVTADTPPDIWFFPGDRRNKGYAEMQALRPDDLLVTKSELDQGFALAELTRGSEFYKRIINGGLFQVAAFFEVSGVRCKVLIDFAKPPMLLDFKSIRDCGNHSIKQAIYDYGLDLQASFYTVGFSKFMETERFVIHFTGKSDKMTRAIEFENSELFDEDYFSPILLAMEAARKDNLYPSIYPDFPESFAIDTSKHRNAQREKVCELYGVRA